MKIRQAWQVAAVLVAAGCSGGSDGTDGRDGNDGSQGPPGVPGPGPAPTPTDTNLAEGQALPGAVLTITSLAGGSGPAGQFQVADPIRINFTLTKGDGSSLGLDEIDSGGIFISGPTSNYQQVIARKSDLKTLSVKNADGSYTYTFASAFPAVYAAPINDTASFGAADGEMTGLPLVAGTYTVGIDGYKTYNEDATTFRDPVNATKDFLFGTATVLDPREVVTRNNCNQCHVDFQAHGGGYRRDLKLCVMCHTSGAEDNNNPALAGGTPGVTIDFRVMIHRIHNGLHLPSVLGVGTLADGSRDYTLTPEPLEFAGGSSVHDFSGVTFPVWPNFTVVMPRDAGYSALSSANRSKEDGMRRGVTACAKCHGDPDAAGPMAAPAQGDNAYGVQSRRACGSCHDDVDWALPYAANGVSMPAQAGDTGCTTCHPASGTDLSPVDAHVHPLLRPTFNPGLNFDVTAVTDPSDGTVDVGDRVRLKFTIKDDAGANVPVSAFNVTVGGNTGSMNYVIGGPTYAYQALKTLAIPLSAVPAPDGSGVYAMNLPEALYSEVLGTSTASATDAFTTARAPLWTGTTTAVLTASVGGPQVATLAADAPAFQNFIDVAAGHTHPAITTPVTAATDIIVIDEGTPDEEYLAVRKIVGNRFGFDSVDQTGRQPFLRKSHLAGATVGRPVMALKTATTHYTLNAATGAVDEVGDAFGAGNRVLVNYTSDYVVPALFPPPYDDTPDMDESWGEWTGKPIVDGTYRVNVWGVRPLQISVAGQTTDYRGTARGKEANFLLGAATTLEPYNAISSGTNCYRCHNELFFHGGGRRGFDTCISCHGQATLEDRPIYTSGSSATPALTASFRSMLHKIHMGEELPDAATFPWATEGVFPAMPGGVKNCIVCHGATNANWQNPPDRTHPAGQVRATRSWRGTCGQCHSGTAATAHIDANTATGTNGAEACAVCHGQGKEWNVPLKHFNR